MKKLFAFTGLLLMLCMVAHANDTYQGFGQFASKEIPHQRGSFPIEINFKVDEPFQPLGKPELKLPKGWRLSCPPSYSIKGCGVNRKIAVVATVIYSPKNLPFFPQTLNVCARFASSKDTIFVSTQGHVYFTPYRTTEVWSAEDFADLSRVWHNANSQIDSNRRFVAKNSIPKSDVTKNYQVLEIWQDDLQLIFVKGLAYSIPRKAIHPDTLEAMYDRGEVNEYRADDPPEETPANARFRIGGKTFDGTVSGRLVVNTTNDFGAGVTIPLAGVRVRLMEEDIGINEEFGQTYTDANGNFSMSYSRRQSFAEGKNVELFLVYHTYNGEYDIKVKKWAILGPSYEEHTWLGVEEMI